MRFLTLELDGRSTIDRAQQRLYGVVLGQQLALAHAPGGAERATYDRQQPSQALRRWLASLARARWVR